MSQYMIDYSPVRDKHEEFAGIQRALEDYSDTLRQMSKEVQEGLETETQKMAAWSKIFMEHVQSVSMASDCLKNAGEDYYDAERMAYEYLTGSESASAAGAAGAAGAAAIASVRKLGALRLMSRMFIKWSNARSIKPIWGSMTLVNWKLLPLFLYFLSGKNSAVKELWELILSILLGERRAGSRQKGSGGGAGQGGADGGEGTGGGAGYATGDGIIALPEDEFADAESGVNAEQDRAEGLIGGAIIGGAIGSMVGADGETSDEEYGDSSEEDAAGEESDEAASDDEAADEDEGASDDEDAAGDEDEAADEGAADEDAADEDTAADDEEATDEAALDDEAAADEAGAEVPPEQSSYSGGGYSGGRSGGRSGGYSTSSSGGSGYETRAEATDYASSGAAYDAPMNTGYSDVDTTATVEQIPDAPADIAMEESLQESYDIGETFPPVLGATGAPLKTGSGMTAPIIGLTAASAAAASGLGLSNKLGKKKPGMGADGEADAAGLANQPVVAAKQNAGNFSGNLKGEYMLVGAAASIMFAGASLKAGMGAAGKAKGKPDDRYRIGYGTSAVLSGGAIQERSE